MKPYHKPDPPFADARRRAVTLTELLVVLVIISILSTIAVPVYINHAEHARVATAQQEVMEIANAEDACGAIHNFYVPLEVLDDLPGQSSDYPSGHGDAIRSENSGVFIYDFELPINLLSSFGSIPLSTASNDPRVINLENNWGGPFLNPQRVYTNTPNDNSIVNQVDFPLDPWGNPYRLFSPLGIIGNNQHTGVYQVSDFNGFSNQPDPRIDRWAVVSFGPDGIDDENGGSTNRDDIIYNFGIVRESTTTPFP